MAAMQPRFQQLEHSNQQMQQQLQASLLREAAIGRRLQQLEAQQQASVQRETAAAHSLQQLRLHMQASVGVADAHEARCAAVETRIVTGATLLATPSAWHFEATRASVYVSAR